MSVVTIELDIHERTVLWAIWAVGHPLTTAELMQRIGPETSNRLAWILPLLLRCKLIASRESKGAARLDLTARGLTIAVSVERDAPARNE